MPRAFQRGMPSPAEITEGLTQIVRDWLPTAVLWHVVLAGMLFAAVKGLWRPSARIAALAATTPLASAAAFAWVGWNPFNGVLLTLATLALSAFALRLGDARPGLGGIGARWAGVASILLGWLYPHFLEGHSLWMYAIASPIGLVPCPSLCVTIGLGLYFDAFGARAWGLTAGALGLFYGIFGVALLGVWIDLPLIASAAFLVATSARRGVATDRPARGQLAPVSKAGRRSARVTR